MRQAAARVKHPCFGVRVASVHKTNRLHLENVACRGEKLLFEKTVFKTFCGEKDDKYVKTPRKSAVFSVLHLSSTHFVRRLQFGYLRFQTRIGNQQDRIRFGGKEQQNEHTTSCSITIAS